VRRIILDTDLGMGAPGSDVDDGFALALALADPALTVELVTTVNGNTDVDTATRLTVELLHLLGRPEVPVARGAETPLVGSWSRRDPGAPPYRAPSTGHDDGPEHAAAEIVRRVMAEPGQLTVVAIGPLTNVALALALEPRVAGAVAEIVVMGGVYLEQTNTAGMPGEFNFWVDPHAADEVLTSGAQLRFVGLDVTRRVRMSREHAQQLKASGGDFAHFAAVRTDEWITHLERTEPGGDQGSCALHDPLAVAVVEQPEFAEWKPAHVRVETASERTRGIAVADLLTSDRPPAPNCRIATGVDVDGFTAFFLDRIASFP
jgi:purine nucleosidase